MRKNVAFHNLGCKVNAYETEAMQQLMEDNGFAVVPFAPGADIYIINTCTVTNIADRKSRQMLHKAKKMNPKAIVIATGCYVQAGQEQLEKDEAIDIIVGNNQKQDIIGILEEYEKNKDSKRTIPDMKQPLAYENLHLSKTGEHTRAYVKVQDGCNQFCTYCIIPYVRGRVRSRKKDEIIQEVRRLSENGYQEFVLTGIHLSSYGIDCEDNLLSLIKEVHGVEGVKRIRLGSLEPRIVTEEFAGTLSRLSKICPHFHLSLQSGCDETLKRMNRRYDTKEYEEKCKLLRNYFLMPAITTDVIVGFPGETQEDFQISKDFVERIHFFETHIFKYSKREGTKAAIMPDQVSEPEKNTRSHELIALGTAHKKEYLLSFVGKEVEILIEETAEIEGKTYWMGYTKEYLRVAVRSSKNLENKIIKGIARALLMQNVIICEI